MGKYLVSPVGGICLGETENRLLGLIKCHINWLKATERE